MRQWLTRPSRNEKKEALWLNAFLMKLFLFLKELLSIAHFISHEFDIRSVRTLILRPQSQCSHFRNFYYPQNRLKTPSGEQKTENFSVPYRVVLKRDRTTDVAEP